MFRARILVTDAFVFSGKSVQKIVSLSVSYSVREQNCTLVASCQAPSTDLREYFCEFSSCKELEYCITLHYQLTHIFFTEGTLFTVVSI